MSDFVSRGARLAALEAYLAGPILMMKKKQSV
jgi:hypothetical protein